MKKTFAFLLAAVAVSLSLSLVGCEIGFNFNTPDPTNEISAFDSGVSVADVSSGDTAESSVSNESESSDPETSVAVSSGDGTGDDGAGTVAYPIVAATMYPYALDWVTDDYLRNNLTRNAEYNGEVQDDASLPSLVINVIKTQDEFESAFASFPEEVDFGEEMLITYAYTEIYNLCPYELALAKIKDNVLHILYNRVIADNNGHSTDKVHRIFAFKVKKCEYEIDISVASRYTNTEESDELFAKSIYRFPQDRKVNESIYETGGYKDYVSNIGNEYYNNDDKNNFDLITSYEEWSNSYLNAANGGSLARESVTIDYNEEFFEDHALLAFAYSLAGYFDEITLTVDNGVLKVNINVPDLKTWMDIEYQYIYLTVDKTLLKDFTQVEIIQAYKLSGRTREEIMTAGVNDNAYTLRYN